MSKAIVNMTPNPSDIHTIHCSQGDTEAREWEFELHNNGEIIDASEIADQITFKAYKGGTEQILPENGSTPTTSPFLGDIRYPQGLLADQEFTYRQSPTEEDGLAKITDIKGNTIVWNQQVDISVVSSSSVINGITYERQAEEIKATGTASAESTLFISGSNRYIYNFINGHLYYLKGCPSGGSSSTYYMSWSLSGDDYGNGRIARAARDITGYIYARIYADVTVNNLSFKPQLFDLTLMGIDDLTTPAQVEQWLSTHIGLLPYYSYNQGSLLSFNGNGIKTVGKNFVTNFLANSTTANISWTQENGVIHSFGLSNGTTRTPTYTYAIPLKKGSYILSGCDGGSENTYGLRVQKSVNGSWESVLIIYDGEGTFTLDEDAEVRVAGRFSNRQTTNYDVTFYPMIRYADAPSGFEPYTESVLSFSLPTLRSANTIYDEATPNKTTIRLKEVTFSSVSAFDSSGKLGVLGEVADAVDITGGATIVPNDKSVFETYSLSGLRNNDVNGITQYGKYFYVRLQGKKTLTEYNTYLSANPLTVIYELATPTETSLTTASLVTENSEIPLSNNDGTLIGKCTEQLSAEPGFHDAKIKLSDSDGECYSNKIQLHVERKPS